MVMTSSLPGSGRAGRAYGAMTWEKRPAPVQLRRQLRRIGRQCAAAGRVGQADRTSQRGGSRRGGRGGARGRQTISLSRYSQARPRFVEKGAGMQLNSGKRCRNATEFAGEKAQRVVEYLNRRYSPGRTGNASLTEYISARPALSRHVQPGLIYRPVAKEVIRVHCGVQQVPP